jgi:hypothetical protein
MAKLAEKEPVGSSPLPELVTGHSLCHFQASFFLPQGTVHSVSLRYTVIFSSHLSIGLEDMFPRGFPIAVQYAFVILTV